MNHTKEPWRVHGDVPHRVVGAQSIHEQIAVCERGYSGEGAANAARIVACVNACAGIADPSAIPAMLKTVEEVASVIADDHYFQSAMLRNALAKLKGGA